MSEIVVCRRELQGLLIQNESYQQTPEKMKNNDEYKKRDRTYNLVF